MPAKGSVQWYRDRRDPPSPLEERIRIDLERSEFLRLLRAVYTELGDGIDGPGHSHEVPGIWGDENIPKSGTPCEWCKTWNHLRQVLARYPA